MQEFVVYKIEQAEDGKGFTVFAKDADTTKQKRRKIEAPITDPTSFYVGQKVRIAMEDAS